MCKYKFKNDKHKSCELEKFLSQVRLKETSISDTMFDLPIDSKGECIFHSRDLEWKRENNFIERLKNLIFLLDKYDEKSDNIELDDFILIGDTSINTRDIEGDYSLLINTKGDKFCILLKNILCKKHLTFNNAIIQDTIIIERCCFKVDIELVNCIFHKQIFIKDLTIGKTLWIKEKTEFKKNFVMANDSDSRIYDACYIDDSIFADYSIWKNLEIFGSCSIENNIFKSYTVFNDVYFSGGLNFRDNKINHILFNECGFYSKSVFRDFEADIFEMLDPIIGGELNFVGNENKFLFGTQDVIDVDESSFLDGKLGRITFDFCNLLNLTNDFLKNCRNLEVKEKIKINSSCKVERLTIIYEYRPFTELKSNLLEDFANIVSRYFYHWHSINLSVNILRDRTKQLITVVYKTTDDITEEHFHFLLKKLPETICCATDNEPEVKDLQRTLIYVTQRIVSDNVLSEFENNVLSNLVKNTIMVAGVDNVGTINNARAEEVKETRAEFENNDIKNTIVECINDVFSKYLKEDKYTYIMNVHGDYIDARESQNGVVGGKRHTFKKPVIKKQVNEENINVNFEKKKSFWNGFIGALIVAVIGCAIWYIIQTLLD